MKFFGYVSQASADAQVDLATALLQQKLDQANKVAVEFEAEANRGTPYRVQQNELVEVDLGDPSPFANSEKGKEKRREYVARVAGLHTDILKPKLLQMISSSYALLENSNNDRELDQSIKGTIYAFRELILWGDSMLSERVQDEAEARGNNNNQEDNED